MNNVVSINRKRREKFSGFSAFPKNERRRTIEEVFLPAGAAVSLILLPVICITVFAAPQAVLFAGSALTGILAGISMFYLFPARTGSSFNLSETPATNPVEEVKRRRAA